MTQLKQVNRGRMAYCKALLEKELSCFLREFAAALLAAQACWLPRLVARLMFYRIQGGSPGTRPEAAFS